MFELWNDYLKRLGEAKLPILQQFLASLTPLERTLVKRFPPGEVICGRYMIGVLGNSLALSPLDPRKYGVEESRKWSFLVPVSKLEELEDD